jgi:hypothetical protein
LVKEAICAAISSEGKERILFVVLFFTGTLFRITSWFRARCSHGWTSSACLATSGKCAPYRRSTRCVVLMTFNSFTLQLINLIAAAHNVRAHANFPVAVLDDAPAVVLIPGTAGTQPYPLRLIVNKTRSERTRDLIDARPYNGARSHGCFRYIFARDLPSPRHRRDERRACV